MATSEISVWLYINICMYLAFENWTQEFKARMFLQYCEIFIFQFVKRDLQFIFRPVLSLSANRTRVQWLTLKLQRRASLHMNKR